MTTLRPFQTPRRPGPLARLATTGIYLLRDIPRELQATARARAATEGTTVHAVLLRALREYAEETWTPSSEADALRSKDVRSS